MAIKFVKVTRPLDLGDYDEAFRGQVLFVWVNPTEAVRDMRRTLLREYRAFMENAVSAATPQPGRKSFQAAWTAFARLLLRHQVDGVDDLNQKNQVWLENILNQNTESPCTLEEIAQLQQADHVLYDWIVRRAVEMIEQYQVEKKSPLKTPLKRSTAPT